MSETNDKEMSDLQDKEGVGQDLSEAREDEAGGTQIVQEDETQIVQDDETQIVQDDETQIVQDDEAQIVQDDETQIVQDDETQIVQDDETQNVQDVDTQMGEEVTVAREDDGGEAAAEEVGEDTAGPEETEIEKEGGEPATEGGEPATEGGESENDGGESEMEGGEPEKQGDEPEKERVEPEKEEGQPLSENPSESIEADGKDPQAASEAVASEPIAAVEPPSPEPSLTNQTSQMEQKSLVKNDNDYEQDPMAEPEKAAASEENMDTDIKEENDEEPIQRGGIIDADILQSKDNFPQVVPFKQDHVGEETPVTANQSFSFDVHMGDGDESGTEEEQAAFMRELENFFRERNLEFKPPKFYGEGLNCLKLWRAVTRLGGYDQVTSCKLWRQVGESFNPPKTCTTVSWSFRCFYEKALLEYERHKVRGGELHVTASPLSEPVGVDNQVGGNQASGSGRARRDAAARAMQGWHSQRLLGNGEVGDPIIKDKGSVSLPKREKQLKSLSLLKRKKTSTLERAVKVARSKGSNPRDVQMGSQAVRMDTMVADIGPAADWVKINVRRTKDCYEVYALVPGLLREEVRVQSDASGRLVISGDPEQPDNPWGVTPFKKVISLPSRIDAHQTSAVVTLHGQLFVRAPFEPSDL
ncbi:hypothetical protein H6P81_001127 [Aristolochia fimbriata]|uniref:AT-rich interactive domain-containing protein 3 n=1 Tax=Aristolochia fimbriata TaxID=158543 RepID=A0AAV7F7H7_ARIFI|nr:hypothetical protein H6P81_001127 [Aristolochia fimbriata]